MTSKKKKEWGEKKTAKSSFATSQNACQKTHKKTPPRHRLNFSPPKFISPEIPGPAKLDWRTGRGRRNPQEDLDACDLQWLHILGVCFAMWRAGDQIVSLLLRTEGLGALESGSHKTGGAEGSGSFQRCSQWVSPLTLVLDPWACYPCPSTKRMCALRGKACLLSLALDSFRQVSHGLVTPALPQHPPKVQLLHQAFGLFLGGEEKIKW